MRISDFGRAAALKNRESRQMKKSEIRNRKSEMETYGSFS